MDENQSFSDVILELIPAKRGLSRVLAEIGGDDELEDRIEATSWEMRLSKMGDAEF